MSRKFFRERFWGVFDSVTGWVVVTLVGSGVAFVVSIIFSLNYQDIWLLILTIFVLTSTIFFLVYASARPYQIVIRSAVYGVLEDKTKTVDVTHDLSSRISARGLKVIASHKFLGIADPAEGEKKELRVDYFYAGKGYSKKVREDDELSLP